MSNPKAASLNPESFVEGSGLIDDVNIVVAEAKFEMYDYNGKSAAVPSLKVTMEVEDPQETITQYYSMGAAKDWMPSEDGKQLISVGNASGIRMSSNGGIFLKSLIDSGFPPDKLVDDISIIDGLQAHVVRIPAPERKNLTKTAEQKAKEEKYGPPTLLVISEIITLPWEKSKPAGKPPAGKPAGKPSGTSKPASGKPAAASAPAKEEGSDDINEKAIEVILEIISEMGAVEKKDLPAKIFQIMKKDPARNAVVKIAFDDEFLASGPWTFEEGTLLPAS